MTEQGNCVIDTARLVSTVNRFCAFVRQRDGYISFVDGNTVLGREENYKAKIAVKAYDVLEYAKWKESWIGRNGEITARVLKAMNRAGNLVNRNQQIRFANRLDPSRKEYRQNAERALYDIYKSQGPEQEATAFAQAKETFGGYYDTIAYLWFIKDGSRFLPVSPGNFEKSLTSIGIDYKLSNSCSWDNYNGFIEIVREIQGVMKDVAALEGVDIRLIDAHSFLWVINESRPKDFRNWRPDEETEALIERETEDFLEKKAEGRGGKKSRLMSAYTRSAEVVKVTKERAKGICELCEKPAPFRDKKDKPYLETHHVIWLSRGGADSTENTVALCPNCHTRMHVLDDSEDINKLLSCRSEYKGR